ncbi:MAG: enoyl-CoA hydratase-related protein, partial [Planctomycetota bacterium]|nr:enoyl-CoA hydratase-related protein [Planctomycetota bacterium]
FASRLCVAGLPLTAHQARDLGLVLDVVSPDDLWVRAHELAEAIAKNSPSSLSLAKRVLLETVGEDLESFLSTGAAAMATARTTPSAREGIQAFLDKRPPDWLRE